MAVTAAKGDELPPGVLFIAYGDLSSRLMGGDTHGSGMPTSKGLDVAMEKVALEQIVLGNCFGTGRATSDVRRSRANPNRLRERPQKL